MPSSTMKKYICILASAALLAACEQKTETTAPEAASPTATTTPAETTPATTPAEATTTTSPTGAYPGHQPSLLLRRPRLGHPPQLLRLAFNCSVGFVCRVFPENTLWEDFCCTKSAKTGSRGVRSTLICQRHVRFSSRRRAGWCAIPISSA